MRLDQLAVGTRLDPPVIDIFRPADDDGKVAWIERCVKVFRVTIKHLLLPLVRIGGTTVDHILVIDPGAKTFDLLKVSPVFRDSEGQFAVIPHLVHESRSRGKTICDLSVA